MDENQEPKRPDGSLDRLTKDLYSRTKDQVVSRERRTFKPRDFGVSESWKEIDTNPEHIVHKRRPIFKILLLISLAFFVVSVVVAAFFFFRSADVSTKNVAIEVQGPVLIGGGETLELQIDITNNNPVAIEDATLIIEYPDGTRSSLDAGSELRRYREGLDTLNPREKATKSVEAILFGEENTTKTINIVVEYRVSGSNATFVTEAEYDVTLSTSPLSLIIEGLEEAVSGQEVEFTAIVKSNSAEVVEDVMLSVEYPFGFDYENSTPDPHFANRVWYLGDIPSEGEKEITFSGTLIGQDGEERVFRFATGLQSETDGNAIGAEFINIAESLFIKRPFITVDLEIDGKSGTSFVAEGGDVVRSTINWTNNLPTQVFDAEIEVKFTGGAVDERSISANNGFYRSIDDKIVWTRDTYGALGSIPAGEEGTVTFNFKPLGLSSGVPLRNPVIGMDVTVRGKRLSDANVPEEIVSTVSKQVKVSSDLILTSKVLHFTGPFTNSGPMPPRAEQETTYTVVLNVLNSSNEVSNGRVSLTLPPYIEWAGQVTPGTEEITFSPVGGQIIWNLGTIDQGVGTSKSPREVAFQVKLVPSITQIGLAPIVINSQTVSGFDLFTETDVSGTRGPLTIDLTEPGFSSQSHGSVAP